MFKRFASYRVLLASASLATFVATSPALAASTVEQQDAPKSFMQEPSYITYLRNNGFTINIPAGEARPQRGDGAAHSSNDMNDVSSRSYSRLNGFRVDQSGSVASAAAQAGTDGRLTASDASNLAYRRLNGFDVD